MVGELLRNPREYSMAPVIIGRVVYHAERTIKPAAYIGMEDSVRGRVPTRIRYICKEIDTGSCVNQAFTHERSARDLNSGEGWSGGPCLDAVGTHS